nr:sensor histidine kinase [Curvibacter sp. CHRR-16]
MLTPLLLIWPISLALIWLVAHGIASKPQDRTLRHGVQVLAHWTQQQDWQQQHPTAPMPQLAKDLLQADSEGLLRYQIYSSRHQTLAGEALFPLPADPDKLATGVLQLRDEDFQGDTYRVAAMWVPLPGSDVALVQVAETLNQRDLLAVEIVKGVMLPQLVTLPLAVLLVWLALVQAIKPLHRLEERIRARNPDDLSPLDVQAVPTELHPLVASVNDLLKRLQDSIVTQKRFLADAAHQLKTPLAGLRMQADLAQRQDASAEDLKQSLRQIRRSSMRATHTVNQLLALARAESSSQTKHQSCDMAALVMDVVRDCLPRAMDKGIDLGYEGAQPQSPHVCIQGNPVLLKEMVRNLVDNAVNYTPSSAEQPGIITARVLVDPFSQALAVQVEDNGPGIAPAERELVFQPFYRALGNEVDGSGLGLSIVQEIARQHQATITLMDASNNATRHGACFTVRFMGQA